MVKNNIFLIFKIGQDSLETDAKIPVFRTNVSFFEIKISEEKNSLILYVYF